MANRKETAAAFAGAFVRKERDNGEAFYCLADGSPEWMSDAIRAAHDGGEMLPNDWSYRFAEGMASGRVGGVPPRCARGAFPADTANRDRRQSGSCRVTRGTLSQSEGLRPAFTLTWRVAAAKPGEDAVRASSPGSTLPCTMTWARPLKSARR